MAVEQRERRRFADRTSLECSGVWFQAAFLRVTDPRSARTQGSWSRRKKRRAPVNALVKDAVVPSTTLVLTDTQFVAARLVEDCRTMDLPAVSPAALNRIPPVAMASEVRTIGPGFWTVMVMELVAVA